MRLNSRKNSEGSSSLFGRVAIPTFGRTDFPGKIKDHISGLISKKDWSGSDDSVSVDGEAYHVRDLSAYGFEKYRVANDDVFVRSVQRNDLFSDAEPVFSKVDTGLPAEDYQTQYAKEPETVPEIIDAPIVEDYVSEATQIDDLAADDALSEAYDEPRIIVQTPVLDETFEEDSGEQHIVADESEEAIQSLFGGIERGYTVEFKSVVGFVQEGVLKETAANYSEEEIEFMEAQKQAVEEDIAIDEMERIDSGIQTGLMEIEEEPAEEFVADEPAEEIMMIKPYEQKVEAPTEMPAIEAVEESPAEIMMIKPYEQKVEAPTEIRYVERATPKLEDFFSEEAVAAEEPERIKAPAIIPEWTVTEGAAESFIDYISSIPAEESVPVIVAAPAWDVSDETCAAFADYIEAIPRESTWAKPLPEWDIGVETAAVFDSYMNIWPQYPKAEVAIPEWDATEEAVAAFDAYMNIWPEYPKAPVTIPEWDATEATAEVYADYLASIPRESTWAKPLPEWDIGEETAAVFDSYMNIWPEYPKAPVIIPEWDATEEAVAAFDAYMNIWPEYPKAEVTIPEWDATEETGEAFADFIGSIPRESTWSKPLPEWDATEMAAAVFADHIASIPEESTWAIEPVWEVTDEAVAAFDAYMTIRPEYPKASVTVPEWDATEEAAEGFIGFLDAVKEEIAPVVPVVVAHTVSVSKIELDPIEDRISDEMAMAIGSTGNYAETDTEVQMKIKVKDNTDINQENLQITSTKKVRASHFVFKDGRLVKVVEEKVIADLMEEPSIISTEVPEDVPMVLSTVNVDEFESSPSIEEAPAETIAEESEPKIIALPAAQSFAALPAPKSAKLVAKNIEGVRFSFGGNTKGCGSIRFSF